MDNFIVSARKYRPSTFDEVVGQQSIVQTLKNAIRTRQIAQAFLFTGPRGVGKTTTARIFAKTINCQNLTPNFEPCNHCDSCKDFNNNTSLNIFELDAASNNSVDNIRSLIDQVRIPPHHGKYKVYIIDEVHMLSQNAFNAFLKTLEEPPDYVKFILATTEKHKVMATILSRCQVYDFKRITTEDIVHQLQHVAQNEGISYEVEALHVIAEKADGAMRDALSIFDQLVTYSGCHLTYQKVAESLYVLSSEDYFKMSEDLLGGKISDALILLNDIIERGFEGQMFINGLGKHFRNLWLAKDPASVGLLEVSETTRNFYLTQAQKCSLQFLAKALNLINQCDANYRMSLNKRLAIEITLINICQIENPFTNSKPKAPTTPSLTTEPNAQYSPKSSPAATAAPSSSLSQKSSSLSPQVPKTSASPSQLPKSSPNNGNDSPKNGLSHFGLQTANLRKISNPVEEKKSEKTEENQKHEQQIHDFTEEELLIKWTSFLDALNEKEGALVCSLRMAKPRKMGNNTIVFRVFNSVIENDILSNQDRILDFIRSELSNSQIKLITEITASSENNIKAYTPLERLKELTQRNPAVNEFMQKFNLQPEL